MDPRAFDDDGGERRRPPIIVLLVAEVLREEARRQWTAQTWVVGEHHRFEGREIPRRWDWAAEVVVVKQEDLEIWE